MKTSPITYLSLISYVLRSQATSYHPSTRFAVTSPLSLTGAMVQAQDTLARLAIAGVVYRL